MVARVRRLLLAGWWMQMLLPSERTVKASFSDMRNERMGSNQANENENVRDYQL